MNQLYSIKTRMRVQKRVTAYFSSYIIHGGIYEMKKHKVNENFAVYGVVENYIRYSIFLEKLRYKKYILNQNMIQKVQ